MLLLFSKSRCLKMACFHGIKSQISVAACSKDITFSQIIWLQYMIDLVDDWCRAVFMLPSFAFLSNFLTFSRRLLSKHVRW